MAEELEILDETEAMKTRTREPVREVPRNIRFWRKADIERLSGEIGAQHRAITSAKGALWIR